MIRNVPTLSVWSALLCLGCGADDLFVSANLGKNEDCQYLPEEENAIGAAEYDIAPGGTPLSDGCAHPYLAHLLVHNDNSEDAVVESAQVILESLQRQRINFSRTEPPRPNPFIVTVGEPVPGGGDKAVVVVETIPRDYAQQLASFVGGRIDAVVELHGATSDGGEVESNRFRFSIGICDGCRSLCASDPNAEEAAQGCSSRNLGIERELCIDPGC